MRSIGGRVGTVFPMEVPSRGCCTININPVPILPGVPTFPQAKSSAILDAFHPPPPSLASCFHNLLAGAALIKRQPTDGGCQCRRSAIRADTQIIAGPSYYNSCRCWRLQIENTTFAGMRRSGRASDRAVDPTGWLTRGGVSNPQRYGGRSRCSVRSTLPRPLCKWSQPPPPAPPDTDIDVLDNGWSHSD